jgi:hypothetical protein
MDAPLTFYEGLIARVDGPLHFRFVFQPAMALFLGIRDGIQDSRKSRPAHLLTICTDFEHGRQYLWAGLRSVGKVMLIAAVLDVVYQFIAFRAFHLWGVIYAALILALIPYLIIRGPVNRIARWYASRHASQTPGQRTTHSAL